jgi:hypothetical protein
MRFIGNAPVDGEVRAIASGALATGDTVIVNSDGTVSSIASTGSPAGVGSKVIFEGAVEQTGSTYDTNSNKVIFCYKDDDNNDYATAVVGTVSGTSISFGTPVVYSSINTDKSNATFDSYNNKVVISFYKNNVDTKHCIVGTVSGTNISFGSSVEYDTTGNHNNITFDSFNNKVVVVYADGSNSYKATARVGTVSGTSISFGSPVVFMTGYCVYINATFDSANNKVVVVCQDYFASYKMKAFVGTVSGTSISFGSEANIANDVSDEAYMGITFDTTNNKTVVVYRDSGNSGYATAAVGTVSGTSISFGTPVVITSAASASGREGPHVAFNSSAGKVGALISDNSSGNTDMYFYPLTVSGTSISAGDRLVVDTFVSGSGNHSEYTMTYDVNADKFAMMYADQTGSTRYGASRVISMNTLVTNLTSENFVGFANSGYASGQSAALNSTCSVDKNQSGLTAGETYYVQVDGTLGTTPADPSVVAGTAISSNSIIVKG